MSLKFFVLCAIGFSAICSSCSSNESSSQTSEKSNPITPILLIDAPAKGTVVSKSAQANIVVSGWALSHAGISNLSIYVDGIHAADTTITIARPDVEKALPEYKNGSNSGWTAYIPIVSYAPGQREVKVVARGLDGAVTDRTTTIQIQP